ncbi:hypothetical protein E1B28_006834 [Marasmius oreades]|uniref:Uncharacterized protein n=1 Tax=Marasmius oreades TaxID=181124 RepID=A0A9P8AA94_9AGAR|nr:uncharacterized protein E1B28_006834 [Marasmius oreades]KAG7096161.1 hypothetical protein E1B28_006834 [Marasmius oreades]
MPPCSKKKPVNLPASDDENSQTLNTCSRLQSKCSAAAATSAQPVAPATEQSEDGDPEAASSSKNEHGKRRTLPRANKNLDPARPDRPHPRRSSEEVQAEKRVQLQKKLVRMQEIHVKEVELEKLKSMLREQQTIRDLKARTRAYDLPNVPEETENEAYGGSKQPVGERDEHNSFSDSHEYIDIDGVRDSDDSSEVEIKSKAKQMRPAGPAKSTKSTSGGEKGKKMAAHDRKACQPSGRTGLSKRFRAQLVREERRGGGLADSDIEDIPPGEGEWKMGANEDNMLGFVMTPPVNSQPGSRNSSTVPSRQPSRQPSHQPSVEFNPLPKKGPQQLPRSGSRSASRTGTPAGSRAHSPNPAPSQPQEPRKRAGQRAGTTAKDYPDFVKSNWSSLVLPTAKHAMFASDQPISNFRRDDILLNTIQEVITKTCPETNHICSLDRDAMFQQIYNRLNETCSEIASKAIKVVTEFFSQPEYDGNHKRILEYATWASERLEDGPAFYAEPSPRNVKPGAENYIPPNGLFQSYFVIEMMTVYMNKIAKSCIDYGHPVGLIGLVCAAIKRAFRYYVKSHGRPPLVSLKKDNEKFSEANVGKHVKAFVRYAAELSDDDWGRLMELYKFVPDPPSDEEHGTSSDSGQSIKLYMPR